MPEPGERPRTRNLLRHPGDARTALAGTRGRPRVIAVIMALLVLAACSPGPAPTPPATSSGASTRAAPPPAGPVPGEVYDDQQLVDIARAVVRSRNLQAVVIDTRTLRESAKYVPAPAGTSVTTPARCAAFRLREEPETARRRSDPSVSFAEGRLPLAAQESDTTTIAFTIRSARHDKLAGVDFNKTADLAAECARFERSYTFPVAGGGEMSSTYEVRLLATPPVGDQAYATTHKVKGLGPKDIGAAGLQVLAGTVSIDMALAVWPVDSETTARAVDSMAAFARELLDEAVKNPPSALKPAPAGARSPEELTRLLKSVPEIPTMELYVTPTEAHAITSGPEASPLPPLASCTYDDAAYFGKLAGGATLAQGIVSTANKLISHSVAIISMGSAVTRPYPFDGRASLLRDCTSIAANVQGGGRATWLAVRPLTVKLDADASYAFRYQAQDGTGRSYIRLGARRGTLSVEVGTMDYRPLEEGEVQAAANVAAGVIGQIFTKAGL